MNEGTITKIYIVAAELVEPDGTTRRVESKPVVCTDCGEDCGWAFFEYVDAYGTGRLCGPCHEEANAHLRWPVNESPFNRYHK